MVFDNEGESLFLAVASEYNCPETEKTPCLGVFSGGIHDNYVFSSDWLVKERFEAEALKMVLEHLGLPEDQEITIRTE